MAENFAAISSEENYSKKFKQIKRTAEQQELEFESVNDEPYNAPLTMQELRDAIASNRRTAPGPDGIHNIMIQNILEEALPHILKITFI